MKNKFIITENERKHISNLYGLNRNQKLLKEDNILAKIAKGLGDLLTSSSKKELSDISNIVLDIPIGGGSTISKKIKKVDFDEIISYLQNPSSKTLSKERKVILGNLLSDIPEYRNKIFNDILSKTKMSEENFVNSIIEMASEQPDKNLDEIINELAGGNLEIESLALSKKITEKMLDVSNSTVSNVTTSTADKTKSLGTNVSDLILSFIGDKSIKKVTDRLGQMAYDFAGQIVPEEKYNKIINALKDKTLNLLTKDEIQILVNAMDKFPGFANKVYSDLLGKRKMTEEKLFDEMKRLMERGMSQDNAIYSIFGKENTDFLSGFYKQFIKNRYENFIKSQGTQVSDFLSTKLLPSLERFFNTNNDEKIENLLKKILDEDTALKFIYRIEDRIETGENLNTIIKDVLKTARETTGGTQKIILTLKDEGVLHSLLLEKENQMLSEVVKRKIKKRQVNILTNRYSQWLTAQQINPDIIDILVTNIQKRLMEIAQ